MAAAFCRRRRVAVFNRLTDGRTNGRYDRDRLLGPPPGWHRPPAEANPGDGSSVSVRTKFPHRGQGDALEVRLGDDVIWKLKRFH